MKSTVLAAVLVAASSIAAAAPQTYTIDPQHTSAAFEIDHGGLSLQHGAFTQVNGKLMVDAATGQGSVNVAIDVNSLDTGVTARDQALKSPQFFNASQFPTITFKAKALKFSDDKLPFLDGELTMLGTTRPVTLRVTHFGHGKNPMTGKDTYGVNAETQIKRSDFGMKAYLPAIGDDVKINVTVEAVAN